MGSVKVNFAEVAIGTPVVAHWVLDSLNSRMVVAILQAVKEEASLLGFHFQQGGTTTSLPERARHRMACVALARRTTFLYPRINEERALHDAVREEMETGHAGVFFACILQGLAEQDIGLHADACDCHRCRPH